MVPAAAETPDAEWAAQKHTKFVTHWMTCPAETAHRRGGMTASALINRKARSLRQKHLRRGEHAVQDNEGENNSEIVERASQTNRWPAGHHRGLGHDSVGFSIRAALPNVLTPQPHKGDCIPQMRDADPELSNWCCCRVVRDQQPAPRRYQED